MEKLPDFSADLITQLSEMFPDSYAVPSTRLPEREIWVRVGQRKLVAMLERMLKEAESPNPNKKIIKE